MMEKKKMKRRWCARNIFKKRKEGAYHNLVQAMLLLTDREPYFRYMRMSAPTKLSRANKQTTNF